MKRRCAFCLSLVVGVVPLLAQEPSLDPGSFEVEPPLLVQPDGRPVTPNESPAASPTPVRDVAELEKQLERAKKSAASAERLYKAGVLAKVEAEQRALRVVRLDAEFATAQLTQVQKSVPADNGMVQTGQDQHTDIHELQIAYARAQAAAAKLAKAELEAALLNLQRQQKLLALGSGRKSDVARAEEKLAALKRGQQ